MSVWLLCAIVLVSCNNSMSGAQVRTPTSSCGAHPDSISFPLVSETPEPNPVRYSAAALVFTPDSQSLVVAYSRDNAPATGRLVTLHITDGQLIHFWEVGPLDSQRTRLSGDSRFLVAEAKRPLQIWDTQTGQILYTSPSLGETDNDVFINSDGTWVLDANGLVFEIFSPFGRKYSGTGGYIYGEDDSGGAAALNPTGTLIARGYKATSREGRISGRLEVFTWDGKDIESQIKNIFDSSRALFAAPPSNAPVRLTYDSTGKWLGALTEQSVELFDDKAWTRYARQDLALTTFGTITFDPSSSLLAVGYSQGMRVYSTPDLKLVLDKPGTQTTTVAFSPDGCLLAWGDVEGIVHIINSPAP